MTRWMEITWYRLLCRLVGHDSYLCTEQTCFDYGHVVCRRCGRWLLSQPL